MRALLAALLVLYTLLSGVDAFAMCTNTKGGSCNYPEGGKFPDGSKTGTCQYSGGGPINDKSSFVCCHCCDPKTGYNVCVNTQPTQARPGPNDGNNQVPEMSDYLAMALVAGGLGIILYLRRRPAA